MMQNCQNHIYKRSPNTFIPVLISCMDILIYGNLSRIFHGENYNYGNEQHRDQEKKELFK